MTPTEQEDRLDEPAYGVAVLIVGAGLGVIGAIAIVVRWALF